MRSKKDIQEIYSILETLYPNAYCELIHDSAFQLAIAVMLSAQTTDAAVNKCTSVLFSKYDDVYKMNDATEEEIYAIIKRLGLAKTKAHNIKLLCAMLISQFNGIVPENFDELVTLPGIGRKSANVILSCWFKVPAFPVDTHVERTCKRLRIANKDDTVLAVEKRVCKALLPEQYYYMHHRLIFFGRYMCKAQKPECDKCPLVKFCIVKKVK